MTLYFLTPDLNTPSGGIKQNYRQVEILNSSGIDARILHGIPKFRCNWFSSKAPHSYLKPTVKGSIQHLIKRKSAWPVEENSLKIGKPLFNVDSKGTSKKHLFKQDDILIIPEIYTSYLSCHTIDLKKVIFNQGAYLTFNHHNKNLFSGETLYQDPSLLGIIVVSEDSKNYLQYIYPNKKIIRIHNGIDLNLFKTHGEKKKEIVYLPEKNPNDLNQILKILRIKGLTKEWTLRPLKGLSEIEMANQLQQASLFLSSAYQEGFSLPPIEAGACGCTVVGYHGMGGREYFNSKHCYPVSCGDIITFCKTVENVTSLIKENSSEIEMKSKTFKNFITKNFSLKKEQKSIIEAWNQVIYK